MKVLLRSDVDGVGKRGDIIDVAGGFARNHLLPAGKAILATEGVEAQGAAMRRSRDLRDARDREGSETVAKTLVGNTITISARLKPSERKLSPGVSTRPCRDLLPTALAGTGLHRAGYRPRRRRNITLSGNTWPTRPVGTVP